MDPVKEAGGDQILWNGVGRILFSQIHSDSNDTKPSSNIQCMSEQYNEIRQYTLENSSAMRNMNPTVLEAFSMM